MNNGNLYNLALYIGNKENFGGWLNADRFQEQLEIANIVLLKELLGITNDFNFGAPVSRRQKGMNTILDDSTNIFKKKSSVSFSSGVAILPNDYFKYDILRQATTGKKIDILSSPEVAQRNSSYIDAPSINFPIAEIIGKSLNVYPTTISTADLVYYRYPVTPVFDYYVDAAGELVYLENGEEHVLTEGEIDSAGNTSGTFTSQSVELEWGDSEKIDITWLIIKNMGINLSRQDILGIANNIQKEGA